MSSNSDWGALRGSSGAVFTYDETTVTKTGDGRVVQQGEFLVRNWNEHLPIVSSVSDNGYTMEKLQNPPQYHDMNASTLLPAHLGALTRLWAKPPIVAYDDDAHVDKVSVLSSLMECSSLGYDAYKKIKWEKLRVGLTHGDPTIDNIMYRGDTHVIIDPIPATPAVPHVLSVDFGKILFSLYGFEETRYGLERMPGKNTAVGMFENFLETRFGRSELIAAHYWSGVHYLRAAPYMPTEEVSDNVITLAELAFTRCIRL